MSFGIIIKGKNQIPTEQEKAWMAGFFDGEGTVSMTYKLKDNGKFHFKRYVHLVNTEIGSLLKFQKYYGGKIAKKNRLNSTPNNHKDVYIWRVYSDVLPYLIVKKCRADIFLQAHNDFDNFRPHNLNGGYEKNDENVLRRIYSSNTMKAMNKRGL